MKIPISHTTVEKLISLLESCHKDNNSDILSGIWSDFNLVAITCDLLAGDSHRDGDTIDITDDTANWLEAITTDSADEDMRLIAKSLQPNFSVA